jgi:protein transport protein SEC61 subunit gamma and related proteins
MIRTHLTKLQSFIVQSKRVWHILRKPTGEEFKAVSKVSALGLLVIGAVGFAIADIVKLISKIFVG